jgi:integrase
MSLCRPEGSKVWVMDFHFHGQRIRESTLQTSITRAKEVQAKRKQELRDGASGVRKRQAPKLFRIAAADFCKSKKSWSENTRESARKSLEHLTTAFGKKLITDIEAHHISTYQDKRAAEVSGRSVNIEVGLLRSILRKHGLWARLQPDVEFLPEKTDVGHALTSEEETILLAECGKSRSRLLLPFVSLLLETGARYNTIRTLQWERVGLVAGAVKFAKDKTKYSSDRTVPLSQRGMEILRFWAQQFPDRKPTDYVFPYGRVGGAGADDTFGFAGGSSYNTDTSRPIGSLKEAWETARKNAGLSHVRSHDFRHTAVSRMIAARVPLPIIGKIVGWSPSTLARMAARYGHFSLEEMRSAVDTISGNSRGYPQFSPQSRFEGPIEEGGKIQ